MHQRPIFLIFGFGYVASYFVPLISDRFTIYGTKQKPIENTVDNVTLLAYTDPKLYEIAAKASHILVTIPPNKNGDIVLKDFYQAIVNSKNLKWIGYLSSTGVYGNHNGAHVTENSELLADDDKNLNRIKAEKQYLALNKPVNIFRLSGIYGQGRSAFDRINSPVIDKPNHLFSRIHVEDIANILKESLDSTETNIYNLADDMPATSKDVALYAASLMGIDLNIIPYEEAQVSDMLKVFYAQNKIVDNSKMKQTFGELKYPSYIEGLKSV